MVGVVASPVVRGPRAPLTNLIPQLDRHGLLAIDYERDRIAVRPLIDGLGADDIAGLRLPVAGPEAPKPVLLVRDAAEPTPLAYRVVRDGERGYFFEIL